MYNESMRRTILLAAIVVIAALPFFSRAQSQPYIFLTWKAETYVPPHYPGKALPIPNSKITVAVDLVDQGRVVDLSSETTYWYLNDAFLTGGAGITRVAITAPDTLGKNTIRLRVALPNYQGGVMKSVTIPVTLPEIVIEHALPRKEVRGETLEVRGWPYFFNVRDLSELLLSWSVAGKEPEPYPDPSALRVSVRGSLPSGARIPVRFGAENPEHRFETANKADVFTIIR